MNQLVPWSPFTSLIAPFTEFRPTRGHPSAAEWSPSVDIFESDDAYHFAAELPGVRKEDVSVQIDNGVLVLSGQRKLENEDRIRTYHRLEGSYGSFARSFELPEGADAGNVNASFANGVLTVSIAKVQSAKSRRIDVKVA
jgi:HSP20 family protein